MNGHEREEPECLVESEHEIMRSHQQYDTRLRQRRHSGPGHSARVWWCCGALVVSLSLLVVLWRWIIDAPVAAPFVAARASAQTFAPTHMKTTLPASRTYFIERRTEGFMLMASDVPGASVPVSLLPDHFGQYTTDTVAALALAPGALYLAIDAQRDHGDTVWVVTTASSDLRQAPSDATGNFLHWLPDGQHFLFRAFLPTGQVAGAWVPGLWIVDAATGAHQSVAMPDHVPMAQVIDAVATVDGAGLIISLTSGLGQGSTVWTMATDGQGAHQLWTSSAIVGLFAWSPDGQRLAYEALPDTAVPYQPADVWFYSPVDGQRQHITMADGGHGFAPVWSPDSQRLAFVARLNPADGSANALAGRLVSAIHTYSLATGAEMTVAGPDQTGLPRNLDPAWRADGALLFTAMAASDATGAAIGRSWLWHASGFTPTSFQVAPVSSEALSNSTGLFAIVP